jgi:hypothetical protein
MKITVIYKNKDFKKHLVNIKNPDLFQQKDSL